MEILNRTKNRVLADDVLMSSSFLNRLKGLLGRSSIKINQAMLLRPANSIHTFFMRFPIDILFINENNIIIKAYRNMKPFKLTGIYFKSSFVIELHSGIIDSTQTTEGDLIQIK